VFAAAFGNSCPDGLLYI